MQIIDAHHHLWDASDPRYFNFAGGGRLRFWGNFSDTPHRYLVQDYIEDFGRLGITKAVHVEAGFDPTDPVAETRLLQAMADDPASRGFPHAIVGWVDLTDPKAEAVLEGHASHANLRGVRQMLNRHEVSLLNLADRDFLDEDAWRRNFALLRTYGLSFDLSVNPGQMAQAAAFIGDHPDIPVALCHLGFPIERYGSGVELWRAGMSTLAERPNIFVKMSGMGMFDRYWTSDNVKRIVLETIEMFGTERVMFGSNFPIDRSMASAADLRDALFEVTGSLSGTERDDLFFRTAAAFYRI